MTDQQPLTPERLAEIEDWCNEGIAHFDEQDPEHKYESVALKRAFYEWVLSLLAAYKPLLHSDEAMRKRIERLEGEVARLESQKAAMQQQHCNTQAELDQHRGALELAEKYRLQLSADLAKEHA